MPATVGILMFVLIPMKQITRVILISLVWAVVFFAFMFGFFSFCAMSFDISKWSDGFGRFLMFAGSITFGGVVTSLGEVIDESERRNKPGVYD